MHEVQQQTVETFMDDVIEKSASQFEFHQAVREVIESVWPVFDRHPEYLEARIPHRMVEAERIIIFRVAWVDDSGQVQVNRGFRVQMNSAIGPYKGGLRFHPSVNLGILKFLAFEQTFKNALTTLPMGGGKGGSDFNPKGKTDAEVMRFAQTFMSELFRHIGPHTDVPAGDMGVGGREIGYMFGQYKKLANEFSGILTGKGAGWGGSLIRPQATGYGTVYFAEEMLRAQGDSIHGKTVLISGSGNVAQYAVENANRLGAKAVTMSDSSGFIYDPDGIDAEKLAWVMDLKNVRRGRISEYAERFGVEFFAGARPWGIEGADVALPCATQNELDIEDAKQLVAHGIRVVAEGANMPTEPDAVHLLIGNGVLFGPGKAVNAGGVATSGLEMAQNAGFTSWTREEVDAKLLGIMTAIHRSCREAAAEYGAPDNYVVGANIAGFLKVAGAMMDQGIV
ncbi:MAG TPA: NADP-specific glutamate dehydrogenase [Acidimicrobiia bacterium]|nr:NADP-specific glutamate dehydrogenase [Acidimicrobiia bacterium]